MSPVSAPFSQRPYCTRNGLSSPSSARVCASSSGVGTLPHSVSMISAGSPGDRYVSPKVKKLMPNNTINICARRLPIGFLFKSHSTSERQLHGKEKSSLTDC